MRLLNVLEKYQSGAFADPKDGKDFKNLHEKGYFFVFYRFHEMKLRITLTDPGRQKLKELLEIEEKENQVVINHDMVVLPGGEVEIFSEL